MYKGSSVRELTSHQNPWNQKAVGGHIQSAEKTINQKVYIQSCPRGSVGYSLIPYIKRLWVSSLVGTHMGDNLSMLLSHLYFFPLSSPLCLKISINISLGKDFFFKVYIQQKYFSKMNEKLRYSKINKNREMHY